MTTPASRSGILAVLMPLGYDVYFGAILAGVTDAAYENGLRLSIASTRHEHAREVKLLAQLSDMTDGALIILPEQSGDELERALTDDYEAGPAMSVLASVNSPPFPVGSRWPLDGTSVAATMRDTGRPARLDDYSDLAGTIARRVREVGVRSVCGVPIFVDGGICGGIGGQPGGHPAAARDTTDRLAAFTELVAWVISSAATRDRLATLADHQTSLRRVATLVAEEAPAAELFAAVTVEATRVLGVPAMVVSRYDYSGLSGRLAAGVQDSGLGSVVGVPIMVEGRIWGVGCAGTRATEALPAGIADRFRDFTDLVGIAHRERRVPPAAPAAG